MLKFIIDSLDGVDKALHPFYKKGDDGKYKLDVEGVKPQSEFETVYAAHTKEKNDHKATKAALQQVKDKFAPFGERDVGEVLATLDKVPALEQAAAGKGFDQAKVDDMVARGVERQLAQKTAPLTRDIDALKAANKTFEEQVGTLTTEKKHRTIDDAVRTAASAAKVADPALPDVIELLRGKFIVAEDGKVITEAGLTPDQVLQDAKRTKTHWWPIGQGAGAHGGQGGKVVADADNPYTNAGWNMTTQSQLFRTDPARADQLAQAAGHKQAIGAVRPPAPAAAVGAR